MQTVLYPTAKAILPRLTTCVFSKAEHWGRFFLAEPPAISVALKWNENESFCPTVGLKCELKGRPLK